MYSNNSLHLHFLINCTWKVPAKYQVLFGQVQVRVLCNFDTPSTQVHPSTNKYVLKYKYSA